MKTLLIGLDAFDPRIFERLSAAGRLPHLTRYVEGGGYARFRVANPPQSEVSWTSIATGLNPGGHGVFDFVHRDPRTYTPYLSLLQTRKDLFGTRFRVPYTARTIFEEVTRQGYPAEVFWWPMTFPARSDLPVQTLPGLGTPDIRGQLGVGMLFASDPDAVPPTRKVPVLPLRRSSAGHLEGALQGPAKRRRGEKQPAEVEFALKVVDEEHAELRVGKRTLSLLRGEWSPIVELEFKMGLFVKVHAITRVILTQLQPDVRLYVMPLQLHPLHPLWRYTSSRTLARQVWKDSGPFLTLGMPQDTTALEDGCISGQHFLALCESITEVRRRILLSRLDHFEEGLLASVFDSLDRIQHTFWHSHPEIVDDWYVMLDGLVGELSERVDDRTRIVVVSDHGIAEFNHKVHLNRWLIERGYLVPKTEEAQSLKEVDWSRSRAYAVGLNSLYVNLEGREKQGVVRSGDYRALLTELQSDLESWQGADGQSVVRAARLREETFEGPLVEYGPDLVVGYAAGFRASSETGLGKWGANVLVENEDHWRADHCMDHEVVPGVLFSNGSLANYPHPSYRDIPALTIGRSIEQDEAPPPQLGSADDEEAVEERLKSLGYL